MNINKLLEYSLESGASDLHLSVGSVPMVRINGTMKPLDMDPLLEDDMESIIPQVMDEDQIQVFQEKKEIDFSASLDGKGRFRVNFFNQVKGLAGVFRTIPEVVKDSDSSRFNESGAAGQRGGTSYRADRFREKHYIGRYG